MIYSIAILAQWFLSQRASVLHAEGQEFKSLKS